jgi:NAD(P)-dependent dehydrogenase (short-subunit alcohol dehydrogenase family)
MTSSELQDRTCVVTGAGSGIGRAIAEALTSAGATVCEADPTEVDDVEGLARDLLTREGGVDVLVHSAGASYAAQVRGAYLLTQALLPGLRAKDGQVVFINSTVALTATTALTALWNSLRRVVNPQGVRMVSVYAPERLGQPEEVATVVLGALRPAQIGLATPDLAPR